MPRAAKAGLLGLFVAGLVIAFAASGAAQRGMAHMARGVASRTGSRSAQRVGTPLQPNFGPLTNVPGLPFNIQALARPGFGRSGRGQFATPLLWYYPYYFPYEDYGYDHAYGYESSQPPYSDQQPPQTAPQPAQFAPSEQPTESLEPQPPPPEVGPFILVRLDGQVLFAVAFTAVDGRLTYVTREGLRRSFPLAQLDRQATLQMNDANGTSISLTD